MMILQEVAPSAEAPAIEEMITQGVMWLKLGVEAFGATIIGIGIFIAVYQLLSQLFSPSEGAYHRLRLELSRFLALGLEFQLAADILGTAISPSWEQLGKLGAIAILRTALNFTLGREIREQEGSKQAPGAGAAAEEPAAS